MGADVYNEISRADILRRLERLEDERDVREAVNRYSMLTDHGTDEEWLDIWTENGTIDLVLAESFSNRALSATHGGVACEDGIRFSGREALVGFRSGRHTAAKLRPNRETKHMHVQVVCEVDDDAAMAESYMIAMAWEDGEILIYALGRTHDTLVRCADGRWRFVQRHTATAGAKIREKIGRDV